MFSPVGQLRAPERRAVQDEAACAQGSFIWLDFEVLNL